jgi:hypothetical protein
MAPPGVPSQLKPMVKLPAPDSTVTVDVSTSISMTFDPGTPGRQNFESLSNVTPWPRWIG